MPVVLVEVGGVARSGHEYGDRTGIEYEYPRRRHSSYIETGDRFVYQKPGVGYFGCGVIGGIRSSSTSDRLVCDVLATQYFDRPVSLKDPGGHYYEADPTFWVDKVYWGQGVRPLTDARFQQILAAAGAAPVMASPPVAKPAYAKPDTAQAVEAYSVGVAMDLMSGRFGLPITVMPHNNPGFDLRVGSESAPTRFVEVKGTQAAQPVFFMSEGERVFSKRNAAKYTLVVVSGIDLKGGQHVSVGMRDGAVDGPDFELKTTQWRGQLLSTDGAAPA